MPSTHVYTHDKGYGQHHAEAIGREHPAEMRDLDMAPGTEVEAGETQEGTGHLIVGWTDQSGTHRDTAIDPGFFAEHFSALTENAEAI